MNLYVRMIWLLLTAYRRRGQLPVEKLENELRMIVWPNDIDLNGHMNNGRYLSVCDLNRVDLFIRTGLAKLMLKRKWMPIISYHDMNYRKPMKMGQRYVCSMRIDSWDDRYFYSTHWLKNAKGDVVAEGASHAVIRGKGGVVTPVEVIAAVSKHQGKNMKEV